MTRPRLAEVVPLRRIAGEVHELSDEALVSAAAAGDAAALGALFDRFAGDVHRFVARIAGRHAADVDDLVQATFLEAYRCSARFARRSSVKTWLVGIAINVVRHHRRSEARRSATVERYAALDRDHAERPDAATERARQLARFAQALDELPPPLREAYVLCVVEEMPARDAAIAIGTSEGTVWRRVHDARAALRAALDGGAP
jgi:RNA polymerase sigma-70 factor (ECF subfamily)